MKHLLPVLFVAAIVSACTSSQSTSVSSASSTTQPAKPAEIPITTKSPEALEHFKKGDQFFENVRNAEASREFGEALKLDPDFVQARALYVSLFGPVAEKVTGAKHLIFEPDGPLLQLPPSVLVTDDASVERYKARIARPNADEFDFTGTAWLGRDRRTTISVSPRAFLDVRAIAPSKARKAYLGLGNNAVPPATATEAAPDSCDWPLSTWQNPIDAGELKRPLACVIASANGYAFGGDPASR